MVLFYDKTSKTSSFLFFKPSLKNEAITKKYKIHLVLLVHNDIIVKQLTKITRLYYRFTFNNLRQIILNYNLVIT